MLSARADLYHALGAALDITIEQFGHFRAPPNGQIVFSNPRITDRYSKVSDEISLALKRVTDLESEKKKLEQAQKEGWKKFVSGQ